MPTSEVDGVTYIVGDEGEILWDTRYAPLFLATSYGTWDEAQVVAWYTDRNKQFDRCIAKGQCVYLISDISELKAPDATMRKKLGQFGQQFDTPYKGKWIGQTFVMTNPLLRGIVTAVNWLNPNGFVAPTSTAPSTQQAMVDMERAYNRATHEIPTIPSDYAFPPFKSRPS